MRFSNTLLLASTNLDKYMEFRSLFSAYPDLQIVPAQEIMRNAERLGFAEKYETYLENAAAKARLANQGSHYPSLADDTGLEVEALDGRPGVRTARFAKPQPGLTQDQANIRQLLADLKDKKNRNARFVATLVLVIEGILVSSTGVLEGSIAEAPRGEHGFGYDPIFIPKGFQKTLAEMSESEKNSISHRAKALHDLMAQVKAKGIVLAKP